MTNPNNAITVNRILIIRLLIGAGIALAIILIFVLGVDNPNPAWHKTWWVRPIVITPLAGAAGGVFFHLMYMLGKEGTWKKIVVCLIGIIGYAVALWMGTVLGLLVPCGINIGKGAVLNVNKFICKPDQLCKAILYFIDGE